MMRNRLALAVLLVVAAGCGGAPGTSAPPLNTGSATLDLEPGPVALTNVDAAAAVVVQNDSPGVTYTAKADPSCVTADGGIYVAGDGQPMTAIAATPTMFLVYAVGTPPATCGLTVIAGSGASGTVGVTYDVVPEQQSKRRAPAALVTRGVTPAAVTITTLQPVAVTVSGFSGTTTLSAGSCATTPGIQVTPSTLAGGSGTVNIVPFGNGKIARSCTVAITDAAGNHGSISVTLAIASLGKLTVTPDTVQFGCSPGAAPKHCRTTQPVTISEAGATAFQIQPHAFPNTTCAAVFEGPLRWIASDGTSGVDGAGPVTTVAFDGILPATPIGCSRIPITDGGTPAQTFSIHVVPSVTAAPPPAIAGAVAPPCTGSDSHVAVPSAPHGLYAWAPNKLRNGGPNGTVLDTLLLEQYTIGADPTLCGASLLVYWNDVESVQGTIDFTGVDKAAERYTSHGLTVNLLFSDAGESSPNIVTPAWVFNEVPSSSCGGPQIPAYWDSTYEKEWTAVIKAAITWFSTTSKVANHVGYMRFATGGGAEAVNPPGLSDPACAQTWANLGLSYATWQQHGFHMLDAMAADNAALGPSATPHQLIASLPYLPNPWPPPAPGTSPAPGATSIYDAPNAFAAHAAQYHIGLSFENLGVYDLHAKGQGPVPACWTQWKVVDLHWCEPFTTYAGIVPLNVQPIYATIDPRATYTISDLLTYALANNVQVVELYPDEWLQADGDTFVVGFKKGAQQQYQSALHDASLVLGASNGQ